MVPDLWLVGLGGVVGALLRHFTAELVARETFPVGTLTVNVVGSFVLGLVTVLDPGNAVLLFVGTGACGSYTTFSSFSFDTVRLWETDEHASAVAFAALNLVGSIAAIGGAWLLGSLLPV
ncbi:fluoride efflux transporter CrcB [Halorientalis brevis]|uniref:Fluoride-specific ion channel FluC n=1 Tax=Halorientalis brevis TaxID=1126241 RepID=A0ABD6CHY3_9EURY|nr:fluoride efflux transporter CrcB [Halorientalis brevis]